MSRLLSLLFPLSALLLVHSASAEEVLVGEMNRIGLMVDRPSFHTIREGRPVKPQREQDPDRGLKGHFATTACECLPQCIQPEQVDPRVATVGELQGALNIPFIVAKQLDPLCEGPSCGRIPRGDQGVAQCRQSAAEDTLSPWRLWA